MADNMVIDFATITTHALVTMERKLVKLNVVNIEPDDPNLGQYADDIAAQASFLLQTRNPNITPAMIPSIPNSMGKYFSGSILLRTPCDAGDMMKMVGQCGRARDCMRRGCDG